MNGENSTENTPLPLVGVSVRKKLRKSQMLFWLQTAALFLGFGLFFYVIYRIGLDTVIDALSRVGWGFVPIISLNGARHFLRAICIYLAIAPEHRSFKFRHALAARLGGEAVSVITFTGPLLGDLTKALMLKKNTAFTNSAAAIIVDNILYYVSVVLMILGGVSMMLYGFGGGDVYMKTALFAVAAVALLIIAGLVLIVKFHFKPLTRMLKKLSRVRFLTNFIEAKKDYAAKIEDNVFHFYKNRKSAFYMISGLIISAHILSVCEVYLALDLLGSAAMPSTAFVIESLTKVINVIFGFIPGTVGVYEGGNGVILKFLGFTTAIGVALALVRRGAILFWTFIGLTILLWRALTRKNEKA
jgi:uncharacterized membrane protein